MRKVRTYFKTEFLLALRSMDVIFFGVIMPIAIAVLIAAIAGGKDTGDGYTYLQATFGSLITVGICATALMGLPLTLADYRDKKILKQFFVTPVKPGFLLVIQAAINGIIAIFSALCVYLILRFCFHYEFTGNIGMFIVSFLLVLICMYGIGMLIASFCRTVKSANLVCTLVYFPMIFLSGATVPIEIFPGWLQKAAQVLPLTQGIRLLKEYSISSHTSNTLVSVIILAVISVVTIILSVRYFQWE